MLLSKLSTSIKVVRRSHLFQDSVALLNMTTQKCRHREHLQIKFAGEDGLDAGGVFREWYSILCKELFSEKLGLFRPTHAENLSYWINSASAIAMRSHLKYFRFAGRLLGKGILQQCSLDVHLSLPLLKHILGVPISFSDLEFLDEQIYKSCLNIKNCDGVENLCLTFSWVRIYIHLNCYLTLSNRFFNPFAAWSRWRRC